MECHGRGRLMPGSSAKPIGTPGKKRPAIFAFVYPRPPLRSSTKVMDCGNTKPSGETEIMRPPEGLVADYSGASPVASALDLRSGATPRGSIQPTTGEKRPARLVTFLRDPTTPISVTWLNDLTGTSCITGALTPGPTN